MPLGRPSKIYNGDLAGGISKNQFQAITFDWSDLPIQIFGYLAIWLSAMSMAKWGIPEKSIKNVAQRR